MSNWFKDFAGKFFIATMLWVCVEIALIALPSVTFDAGLVNTMPDYVENIDIFYDKRLVVGILAGGLVLLGIGALTVVTIRRFSLGKKSQKESVVKVFAIDLATQILGIGCLLEVSSAFYWLSQTNGKSNLFKHSSGGGQFLTGLMLIFLAFIVHFLASEEKASSDI